MTPRRLMLRAALRVLLRVFAKAFAYGLILAGALWLYAVAAVHIGPVNALGIGLVGIPLVLLALAVFRDKVREEAQRIGGRS